MKHRISWLPGLETVRRYEAAWLPHDIFAGLVLATMLVPVGIAYAAASGLPGIYGLYATIVPLLAYALFGPSRILVLGPDSSLAAIILAVVLAMLLAIASLGGDNATKETLNANIQVTDTWSFYQAKNIRQTANQLAANELEAQLILHGGSLGEADRQAIQRRRRVSDAYVWSLLTP